MLIEDYMQCARYEGQAAAPQAGFTAFHDAETDKFYFAMLDADGKVLLKSEGYPAESGRDNGIEAVIRNRELDERYKVVQGESGRYHLSLRAGNHQEIARSCSVETEAEALALMPFVTLKAVRGGVVLAAAADAEKRKSTANLDEYMACAAYKGYEMNAENPGFTTFQHENGNFYFALLDGDGEVLLKSESYPNAQVRDNGMASVIKNRPLEERYKVLQSESGKYYLSLRAGNHQEIAVSCYFDTEADAAALTQYATGAKHRGKRTSTANRDEYLHCDEYKNRGPINDDGFTCFQHEGEHFFAMFDRDDNLVFRSESYPNGQVRDVGMNSVIRNRDKKERYKTIEEDGHTFVILKAGNHQEIARSCPHTAASALAFINGHQNYAYGALAAAAGLAVVHPELEAAPPVVEVAAPLVETPTVEVATPAVEVPDVALAAVAAAVVAPIVLAKDEPAVETPAVVPPVAETPKTKDDDYLHCDEYKNRTINDKQNNVALFKHSNGLYYFALYNAEGNVKLRSEGFENSRTRDEELSGVLRFHKDDSMYTVVEKAGYRIYILKDKTGREVGRSCAEKIVVAPPVMAAPVAPPVAEPEIPVAALAGAGLVGLAAAGALLGGEDKEEVAAAVVPPVVVPPVVVPPVVVPPVAVAAAALPEAEVAAAGLPWGWIAGAALLALGGLTWWMMRDRTAAAPAPEPSVNMPMLDTLPAITPAAPAAPVTAETKVADKTATTVGGVVLKNIFFDFDKSNIRPDASAELDKLLKVMTDNPTYKVELMAHCDAKGNVAYNNALSGRRAKEAKAYLVGKGVDAKRISSKTFGKGDPIAKNTLKGGADTEEGRQLNRRIEFRVKDANGKNFNEMVEQIAVPTELR
jgi:outer membrane protein OmpA-like peptidoglycan-associated protein/uncharacterized protein YegP (UPF0339 family)